jgi:hypothetical protein
MSWARRLQFIRSPPVDASHFLTQMAIPNPCPMDWNAMAGDDRVRHCSACRKNVHDLTAMSSDAAASLIQSEPAGLCVRVWKSADGTLSVSGCPAPSAVSAPPPLEPRPWQFRIRTLMAIIAGAAAGLGLSRLFSSPEQELVPKSAFRAPSEHIAPRQSELSDGQRMIMGLLSTRAGGETTSSDDF